MTYVPHTPDDQREMLATIGVGGLGELLQTIPDELRLKEPLAVGPRLSEVELAEYVNSLADRNSGAGTMVSFLGGGIYDHHIPAVVDFLSSRSEFYTAYTPYQPEVAQGTLQVTYEFQSLICRLTGMDVANASLYDGSSAVAEAALVALAATGRNQVIVSGTVNPHYLQVLQSYTQGRDIAIECPPEKNGATDAAAIAGLISKETACVIVQSPNFFGQLEDVSAIEREVHEAGGLLIYVFYPIALGVCQTPAETGADLAVGEGQSLGNPPNYGGPLLGLLAAKKEYVRRIPGRIVGRTQDAKGRPGYVMTLQTREQHIRREKATSNICTAQALIATRAAMYTSLMGRRGFKALAEVCTRRAHYLAEKIAALDGFRLTFTGPFFNEFVVSCPVPAHEIIEHMSEQGIMPGIDLSTFFPGRERELLVCVTEKNSPTHLDMFVQHMSKAARAAHA